MDTIKDVETLEALYETKHPLSLAKQTSVVTPVYRAWIEAARFAVLTTVGPEGTDGSPRGDDGPVVHVDDAKTLMMPDWRGNNRLDSLRNIVRDGRVSLMFMIPGEKIVVRVNGNAVLTADKALRARFERKGVTPRSVIVITVTEVYFQCAKSIMRSGLWSGQGAEVPSAGQMLREQQEGFDAEGFDNTYADYAKTRMW